VKVAFLTVGDPARLTGGYLYHREVFARLRAGGDGVTEIVAAGASLAEQLAAAPGLGARFDPAPFDAIVVDALARAACAPWLDGWRAARPLVAMVHELPSVAEGAWIAKDANASPRITRNEGEKTRKGRREGEDAKGKTRREAGEAREQSARAVGVAEELSFEAPLLRADRLIAVSEDGARILVEHGAPPERIVVASGGLDRLRPLRPPTHASRLASRASTHTALSVAQWIPRKGILELARAWGHAARPGWRLELVGETEADPAYAEAVRAALAGAPRGSAVVRGALSDAELADAYGSAALFVLPSRYEGYGIAFAEALAAGLPVVGCAVGPVPALVGSAAGLLAPPGDEGALAAALGRLMDDRALRERMGRAALARAAQLPTWDGCAAAFRGAVEAVITARRS
jgi:glycosyltransferase involved in cell wall biosynthesis